MKANEIVTVLNQFKDSSYQKGLIDGTWGIGKTKYVEDFKDAYIDACYVSLFGKKDIESIIQEIYFQIVDSVPKGKLKKHFSVWREKLNNINVRFYGFSISVPLIENLHKTLYKELNKKNTYIIILDDLERKHESLNIKEVLGLIDGLAKIEKIKTVLIAATDQLKGEDERTFKDYKEKAIDKSFTIDEYADEAPVKILGEQVWNVIGKYSDDFKFKNLRTFKKTDLFIKEVIKVIGEDKFTEKFTKDDVCRMCFATIFFKVEHKSEMKLLDTEGDASDFKNTYYKSSDAGVIEYLCNHILKNSLDNTQSKTVFHHIIKWYDTGTFPKETLFNLISSINNYEEKPKNFYSSEQEILNVIDNTKEYLRNLNGTEKIDEIVRNISTAFAWCEVLSIDFGLSGDEIISLANKNISNSIDLDTGLFHNELDSIGVESGEARNIINSLNKALKFEYYEQLIIQIKNSYVDGSYNVSYLRQLNVVINSIVDEKFRDSFIKNLSDNQFFFPIPSGRISEDLWTWCHQINKLIKDFDRRWELKNYYDDFKNYINGLDVVQDDKLLQHRLKTLFNR
ncbi:P-loop NTPase fold protein [Peribacillus frigoritolerans]|uniref:P-loop NTPase fold protein n=1 Tax=Peribacillus frigoritolerans TaxID=450367 RepID=UPI003305A366